MRCMMRTGSCSTWATRAPSPPLCRQAQPVYAQCRCTHLPTACLLAARSPAYWLSSRQHVQIESQDSSKSSVPLQLKHVRRHIWRQCGLSIVRTRTCWPCVVASRPSSTGQRSSACAGGAGGAAAAAITRAACAGTSGSGGGPAVCTRARAGRAQQGNDHAAKPGEPQPAVAPGGWQHAARQRSGPGALGGACSNASHSRG